MANSSFDQFINPAEKPRLWVTILIGAGAFIITSFLGNTAVNCHIRISPLILLSHQCIGWPLAFGSVVKTTIESAPFHLDSWPSLIFDGLFWLLLVHGVRHFIPKILATIFE